MLLSLLGAETKASLELQIPQLNLDKLNAEINHLNSSF